jgi:hypothetical protein
MPFTVTPSPLVDISAKRLTENDFLKLVLENGEIIYTRPKYLSVPSSYELDREFMPQSVIDLARQTARKDFIEEYYDKDWWPDRQDFEKRFAAREDQDLDVEQWQSENLLLCLYGLHFRTPRSSRHNDGLNIGCTPGVTFMRFMRNGGLWSGGRDSVPAAVWQAEAPIAAVFPIKRSAIRREIRARA